MKVDHEEWAKHNVQSGSGQRASQKPQDSPMTVSIHDDQNPSRKAAQAGGQKGARFEEETADVWKIGAGCGILLMTLSTGQPSTVVHQSLEQCPYSHDVYVETAVTAQSGTSIGDFGVHRIWSWEVGVGLHQAMCSQGNALSHASCEDHAHSKSPGRSPSSCCLLIACCILQFANLCCAQVTCIRA